ncbi:MAG: glutamine-hydrolyzing carbamoyl-phosphate synthase small subunit [Chloroflexia bacterium]
MNEPALLVLEDGRIFHGESFGASGVADGEVVFSTSMTGYQEMCTDPSYHGQILCLTYPLVGNYGVSDGHSQSTRPWVSGLVVRRHERAPSHWTSGGGLHEYLEHQGVPGIAEVDTRALTRHIRSHGSRRGIIVRATSRAARSPAELVEAARAARLPSERAGVSEVSGGGAAAPETSGPVSKRFRVVVIDWAGRPNIRSLAARGMVPVVVPYSASAEDVLSLRPDGVVTSPGPGDPLDAETPTRTVRAVLEQNVPFFGICLGCQILGLAVGGTTSKLKYGHRGGNHPVRDTATGRIHITSQNHGYQLDRESIPFTAGWRVSHENVNDGSVEGLAHTDLPALSVQYHPEGSPGPDDNRYLFDTFHNLMARRSQEEA